jgi:hypothetical protein
MEPIGINPDFCKDIWQEGDLEYLQEESENFVMEILN